MLISGMFSIEKKIYCLVLLNLVGSSTTYKFEYAVNPPNNAKGIETESETPSENRIHTKETTVLIAEKEFEIQKIIAEVEQAIAENPSVLLLDSVVPQVSEYYVGIFYLVDIVILIDEGKNQIQIQYTVDLIPSGISQNLASRIIAEIGNIKRFKGATQLIAYAGTDPHIYQSGIRDGHHLCISQKGNKNLRTLLYLGTSCHLRLKTKQNTVITEFYAKKKQQGKTHRVAQVASLNKLLKVIYSVSINKTIFQ